VSTAVAAATGAAALTPAIPWSFFNSCPVGHYCPAATPVAIRCPQGTYRNSTGAAQASDCLPCPPSFLCDVSLSPVTMFPCPAASYCPGSTSSGLPCPKGSYCPELSASPVPCPKGYFCNALATAPTVCPPGSYCPFGDPQAPLPCPPGTRARVNCTKGTLVEDCCDLCYSGTYSATNTSWSCQTCPAGFVCLKGTNTDTPTNTTTDGGYECPPGNYCPPGSFEPRSCPAGTFNALSRQTSLEACIPCPLKSYQDSVGQTSCISCGATSTTLNPGSTTCLCLGNNRSYQKSYKTCLCNSGFEFIDQNFQVQTGDSSMPCQPRILPLCSDTQVYDATGNCVLPTNCTGACRGGRGSIILNLGVCQASETTKLLVRLF
jgi:hypothetical protein